MRQVFLHHKKLHFWLLADLGLLAAFWLFRGHRGVMEACALPSRAFRETMGRLCDRVPFSVMEALCVLLMAAAAVYLLWSVLAVIRARGRRGQRAYGALLGAVCAGLTLYVGFCALWGVHYYTADFHELSGIPEEPVATEDLLAVTAYFAHQLADSSDGVERDDRGLFAVPRQEILAYSPQVYDALEQELPFLAFEDTVVKPVHFSRVMSLLDFTGVYCPFTGESNVNMDFPACLLPATVAHELAHQRSITSEQACNFLAILSATTCGDPAYVYSGYLKGYIHLGNALYRADPDAWQAIRDGLPETVRRDIASNNAYWAQFRDTAVQKVSNTVYDGFLKGYGDEHGMASYGMVVDLLVSYYKDRI